MKVDPAKAAATVELNETRFFFCSQGCATKFKAEPEKYLQKKEAEAAAPPLPTKVEQGTEYVSVLSTCVTQQTKDMRYSTLEP